MITKTAAGAAAITRTTHDIPLCLHVMSTATYVLQVLTQVDGLCLKVCCLKDKVATYITVWIKQAVRDVEINTKGEKQRMKVGQRRIYDRNYSCFEFWWTSSTYYDTVFASYNSEHSLWVSYISDTVSWIYSAILAITQDSGKPPHRRSWTASHNLADL
jgi:hypothetical protein